MSLDDDGPTVPFVPVDLVEAPERSLLDQIAGRTDLDAHAIAVDDGVRRLSRCEDLGLMPERHHIVRLPADHSAVFQAPFSADIAAAIERAIQGFPQG